MAQTYPQQAAGFVGFFQGTNRLGRWRGLCERDQGLHGLQQLCGEPWDHDLHLLGLVPQRRCGCGLRRLYEPDVHDSQRRHADQRPRIHAQLGEQLPGLSRRGRRLRRSAVLQRTDGRALHDVHGSVTVKPSAYD